MYSHLIGKVVEVDEWNDSYYTCKPDDGWCFFKKADTIPVNEINKTVQCSWQDEMDLKSIAVRFENVEQREAIFKKFMEKGFKIVSRIIQNAPVKGNVGYSYCGDYVCVLSEIRLRGKKIIIYEEFMRGKEMKRLEVSLKIQPDGKTVVGECTYISEELRGKGVLAEKDGYSIESYASVAVSSATLYVRGLDYDTDYCIDCYTFDTPEQAQHYVKIMNELIDEINNPRTNWNKVEEGAEVKVTTERSRYGANFHSYIPNLKKIVLIVGEEVKVVDEDKVELV